MKRTLKAILAMAIISPLLSTPALAVDKGIYGRDDRIELFDASPETRRLADSVVSLWQSVDIHYNSADKTFSLETTNFGDDLNLCPGERFREQPRGPGLCSGSLVGGDLIMTAGHCVKDQSACNVLKIVFGFAFKKISLAGDPSEIGVKDVYSCKKIIAHSTGDEPDYALIQLDRKVAGHKPLVINRSHNLIAGDKVMVMGHPKSLPLKIAAGGTVRVVSPLDYFVTDLDTFAGNSGSPVINAATGLIEGILIGGDNDFIQTLSGCATVATYPQNGGGGEFATAVSALESFIPKPAKGNKSMEISFRDVKTPIGTPSAQHDLSRYFAAGFQ
ncbi:MAG: serine protease [Elusimicrobia bacterium]|nr:serine protease [Elusimicrobiota bacterium]